MPGKVEGVAISDLFNMARRAAREARIHEMRAASMQMATKTKAVSEAAAQEKSLARMRSITRAQLGSSMAQAGVDPTLLMMTGAGGQGIQSTDPATASFIAQAAARGPNAGSMSMRGIGI